MKDILHSKFNDLTATRFVGYDKYKAAIWEFRCICGAYKNIVGSRVSKGHIKSCGCRVSRVIPVSNKLRKKPNFEAAHNELYGNYKRDAKKRDYNFELSLEDFKSIIKLPCYYCGQLPYAKFKDALFTGLDRIDNSTGYFPTNVVPCCTICNRTKSDMNVDEFVKHVIQIAKYIDKINTITR